MDDTMRVIQDYVDGQRDAMLADLAEACRLPSISEQNDELERTAHWVGERLRKAGCEVSYWEVAGGPPVVWGVAGSGERSLMSYSHYDVQPADPLELWHTPPFEPTIRDGHFYARGIADDKGDLLSRIHAIEVYRALFGELPLRFKFFVEGEEEIGSPNLGPVAAAHAAEMRSDGCLWESGAFDPNERYTVYLGVKGDLYVELKLRTASTDLHSAYATIAPNPAWRLVWALSTLKTPDDVITIDGFAGHVRPITPAEAAFLDRIPFDGDKMKAQWGLAAFINEMDNRAALERFLFAPTCTISGFRSGFIDEGQKTVLPSEASVKLDLRLVPDLTPDLVLRLLREHLDRRGFTDIEIYLRTALDTSRSNPEAPFVRQVIGAIASVYGHEPVVYPTHGGSGPMYPLVQGLGMDGVTLGVGYAGVNLHAPNENIRIADYFKQVVFLVELIRRFGEQ